MNEENVLLWREGISKSAFGSGIFKTEVTEETLVKIILQQLKKVLINPNYRIDCDTINRTWFLCNEYLEERKTKGNEKREKKRESGRFFLISRSREGEKTRKAISRIRIPRGVRWLFLFMRKPPWKGTHGRATNPVAICWDFHKLNSLGRHARGVSKLNDNRVSFFSVGQTRRNGIVSKTI